MKLLIDSFWRAALYCLKPGVIALSLLPLVLMVGLALGVGYFYWDPAVAQVRDWLEAQSLLQALWAWLEGLGVGNLKSVLAPLIVIFLSTPLVVILSLLLVSVLMTPVLTRMVAERRFADMERKRGGGFWQSLGWALWSTVLAVLALLLSLPFWLIPPLALVLPALIWGWLTYRLMAFDALAEHADRQERQAVLARHRLSLLGMGVVTGLMGAAPGIVWASGALFAAAFVILVPVAIWIYMVVFSFSGLWFAHYCLAALAQWRTEQASAATTTTAPLPAGPQAGPSASDSPARSGRTLSDDVIDVPARTVSVDPHHPQP